MGCSLDIVTGITGGGGQAARLPASRRWRRLAAVALVAWTGAAAACSSSSSSSTSASAHAPIKVGYLLPLTGIFTKNGTSEQNGFKLGLKHFGTSVDGHPIQVTYANDQGDPSVSLSMARQLVTSDHVQVMEGPLISSAIAVVAPYVLGKGIPEDDLYLASPLQAAAYTRYGTGFTSGWDGFAPSTVGAKWAYTTMGWRHVTTVGLDISFGWQGVGGFAAQFTQLGGKIDKMIWVPSNSVDMSSYVSAIPPGTQAVWVVLSGSQAASFVNTYNSFGLKKKIPLMGITTLTDQAALPAENPAAAAGTYHRLAVLRRQPVSGQPAVRERLPRRLRRVPVVLLRGGLHQGADPDRGAEIPAWQRHEREVALERDALGHDHRAARPGVAEPGHLVTGSERVHLQGGEGQRHDAERPDRDRDERPALGHAVAGRLDAAVRQDLRQPAHPVSSDLPGRRALVAVPGGQASEGREDHASLGVLVRPMWFRP